MERPRWRDVSMWRNPQLPPPSHAPREILPHALGYVPRFVEIYKEKKQAEAYENQHNSNPAPTNKKK